MAHWVFPPMDDDFDYIAAVRALESEEIRPVKDQHVVSKVILKGFASRQGNKGWQLARFDKERRRELDPRGLNACGKIPGFVTYASGSAESLWHSVETRLGEAIRSAESGSLHENQGQEKTIKDGIALHLVRSPLYRKVHEHSFTEAMQGVRDDMLTEKRSLLEAEFRRRRGLEPAGIEALESVLEGPFQKWQEFKNSGALLRISLEQNFFRIRSALENLAVEVLHVPAGKELVISDAPAFTFRNTSTGKMEIRMAIGDSHGIALPITKKCLVAIGPESKQGELTPLMVDSFNRVQVRLAERQIYYRPGSPVKNLIESTLPGEWATKPPR